ncbi:MAG: potassium transporter TrkG [Eubacteriales bacterium]|nr:potassium transporter TrkG [Eubacteriales bacterium]MDD3349673.1 potassium transporter TrkG [Eubacteriales bacterium]
MGLNMRLVFRILGFITALLGVSMLPSLFVSLIYGETQVALCFIKIIIPVVGIGLATSRLIQKKHHNLKIRESFVVVSCSWLMASLIGTLPYLMTGAIPGFVDAFFESTSGFTTTGATILYHIESLPKGILFWRSFSQWLGGMGILIFAISVLPALGISGQLMARIETPGPSLNKVAPRMADSAQILYLIYIIFTFVETVLLDMGGMNLFDALIASFGSVSAGGLSNYSDGILHFNSVFIEMVVGFFTLLVCINFTLYYTLMQRNWKDFFADRELRAFLLILASAIFLVFGNLYFTGNYGSVLECLRFAVFQVTSFLTTTGHYNTDFNQWPSFSKMILFMLMMIGSCAASTGGGIKVIRVLILYKQLHRGFYRRLHPRAIMPIKVQGKPISPERLTGVMSFLYVYVFIFFLSSFLLSFENLDLVTTFTATASILNNVGTGFELIGPGGLFHVFSDPSKIYMCFLMMMGRLELFTILVIFTPSFWSPNR